MSHSTPVHTMADMLAAVSRARIVDLAHPLSVTTPVSPNHPPFRMGLIRRHGDMPRADGSSGANELLSLGGHTGTHIDALCHVAMDGKLHGGHNAGDASTGGRFTVYGVETISPILCRGVLLDIAALHGVTALAPAHRVTAEELDAAAQRCEITVNPGDAVLVRTGWPSAGRFDDPTAFVGHNTGVPGPDASAAHWLAQHQIRATGADTIAYEHLPAHTGHSTLPAHNILLVQHGIHIIEMLNLEELAHLNTTEFLFIAAPLPIIGATGASLFVKPPLVIDHRVYRGGGVGRRAWCATAGWTGVA